MSDNKVSKPDFFKRGGNTGAQHTESVKVEAVKTEQPKEAEPEKESPRTSSPKTEKPLSERGKRTVKVKPVEAEKAEEETAQAVLPIKIDGKLTVLLDETANLLTEMGQKSLLKDVEKIRKELERKKFTVAVVGEFSKGKSTFINKLLDREFLPTGNLPTTALLTKIRYNSKEMLILFDYKGNKQKAMPLKEKSWDGLTADMYGNDPEGIVLAGVNSPWLKKTGIELEDTPGAGDLDEKRAKITDGALYCDDGAIITMSATAAFSMSEKLFIEQRLISQKTPYLMIIVTKLDRVPVGERAVIIDYIKENAKQWNRDIPVYVPYDVEMPDDTYKDIIGLDKIKKELEGWLNDTQRKKLTEQWIGQRLLSVTDALLAALKEQQLLLKSNDDKRAELIAQKKLKLSDASVVWDELRLEMMNRCKKCYEKLMSVIEDNKIRITERLQYEAAHANNPEKWWKEDYPYRLKVELTNLSGSVENIVTRTLAEDSRWFNAALNTNFKTHVLIEQFSEEVKPTFDDIQPDDNIEFENIGKQRNAVRIGTAVLTIAGYSLLPLLGGTPVIASVGLGTGSSIISEKIFKGKIEKQQEALKESIAKTVPELIDKATDGSQKRLEEKYDTIINSAREQESVWMKAQEEAIENSVKAADPQIAEKLDGNIEKVEKLCEQIKNI